MPYAAHVIPVPPHEGIPEAERAPFDCARCARHPCETKGRGYRVTTATQECCGPEGC